jgi:HTH-type transcriptional regulator / antitoxin HigA
MITTKSQYETVMNQIETLMSKGSKNISKEEGITIKLLAQAAQEYEQKIFNIRKPETLQGILELYMFESKMSQKKFAAFLGISETKLSFIINGKRRPDIDLLKTLHSKLNIDAAILLEAA